MKSGTVAFFAMTMCIGCTSVGPQATAIESSDRAVRATPVASTSPAVAAPQFALIEVDRNVIFTLNQYAGTSVSFFPDAGPGKVAIQSGDVLAISLVSVNENGYLDFASASVAPISRTPLPPQIVSDDGTINVPPVGRVDAQGKTVAEVEEMLTHRLGQVLVNPTVVVDLVQRNSALVSVVGAVGAPGSFAYTSGTARIRDLIARAGGAAAPIEGLDVALTRSGATRRVPLASLLEQQRYNIHIRPGDVISLEPRDNAIVILGATRNNRSVRFDEATVSVADVLGEIGGLENRRADPSGVFLYRPLPRDLVTMLGIDVSRLPGEDVLAIFRFDLADPAEFFMLGAFKARDGDLLYVANSPYEQLSAIFAIFNDAGDAVGTADILFGE